MNLKDTKLFFLEKDCTEQFGANDGAQLYALAEIHYEKLYAINSD